MTWAALIFAPLVIGYQAWTYWVFRQRISAEHIPNPLAWHPARREALPRDSRDAPPPGGVGRLRRSGRRQHDRGCRPAGPPGRGRRHRRHPTCVAHWAPTLWSLLGTWVIRVIAQWLAGPARPARCDRRDRWAERTRARDRDRGAAPRARHRARRCRVVDDARTRRAASLLHALPTRADAGGADHTRGGDRDGLQRPAVRGHRGDHAAAGPGVHGAHRSRHAGAFGGGADGR